MALSSNRKNKTSACLHIAVNSTGQLPRFAWIGENVPVVVDIRIGEVLPSDLEWNILVLGRWTFPKVFSWCASIRALLYIEHSSSQSLQQQSDSATERLDNPLLPGLATAITTYHPIIRALGWNENLDQKLGVVL